MIFLKILNIKNKFNQSTIPNEHKYVLHQYYFMEPYPSLKKNTRAVISQKTPQTQVLLQGTGALFHLTLTISLNAPKTLV